ncbi:sugar lactone lactonase YvrE [Streptomyces sp. 846.5]|nr:SMP-30/gluconolactonase/LRE family protein [Streptomyces sp. 846.5]TDU02538.1 sugar lactone lactonase YvrE [Streptomyces sp. 846.5]
MPQLSSEPLPFAPAALGERPVWDDRTGELLWVDIDAGTLHRYRPGAPATARGNAPSVGAVALREKGGVVLAVTDGFLLLDADGEPEGPVIRPAGMEPDRFFNDGACDPAGRFLAGTATAARTPGAGSLYRLDPDGTVSTVLDQVTESNGIAWSQDGTTMYYVDSGTQDVRAYGYDPATGTVDPSPYRTLITIDPADGTPDGLVTDSEGNLWLALWGGWGLRRYSPDGTLLDHIPFPVSDVTCPCFGGQDLRDVFVTTSHGYLYWNSAPNSPWPAPCSSCAPAPRAYPPPATRADTPHPVAAAPYKLFCPAVQWSWNLHPNE